jgi:hypothetical protein
VRIEAKPLQPADTDNNDDTTPTYLEADTQRTVGIPRAAAAAAAAAPLFCSSFAAGKQKKGAGKTERESKMNQKKGKEKKHKKQRY